MRSLDGIIVHPHSLLSPDAGGVEVAIQEFVKYAKGDYHVFSPSSSRNSPEEGNQLPASVQPMKRHSRLAKFKEWIQFSVSTVERLRKAGPLRDKPLRVHVHNLTLALILRVFCPGIELVVYFHNNPVGARVRLAWPQAVFHGVLTWATERWLISGADKCVVFSDSEYTRLSRISPKIIKAHVWFDSELFIGKNLCPSRSGILWVGRFAEVKDPLLALRAASLCVSRHDEVFRMIGDGPLKNSLENFVSQGGLDSRIRILDSASREDIAVSMASSKVLIITSWSESGPKVALEALASGCRVVIVKDAVGFHELGQMCEVVASRDETAIADAVSWALTRENRVPVDLISKFSARVSVRSLETKILN